MAGKSTHPPKDIAPDEAVAVVIQSLLQEGTLTCTAAFAAAKAHGVSPLVVGKTADTLKIELSRCQLGLFGFPGKTKSWEADSSPEPAPPEGLEAAIKTARDKQGNLTCAAAWELADKFFISRIRIGQAADRMGVKITQCQLGAF